MSKAILLLQGGIGNQMIQLAYCRRLTSYSSKIIHINKIKLTRFFSLILGITYRPPLKITNFEKTKEVKFIESIYQILKYIFFKNSYCIINDKKKLEENIILINSKKRDLFITGFFQCCEALSSQNDSFWNEVINCLSIKYATSNELKESIILHSRLGDYRNEKNINFYSQTSLKIQLDKALEIQSQLNDICQIKIITDNKSQLVSIYKDLDLSKIEIIQSKDPYLDLFYMSSHKWIIGTNSTFSLCAGKLSYLLWNSKSKFYIPKMWYLNKIKNKEFINEINKLDFIYLNY